MVDDTLPIALEVGLDGEAPAVHRWDLSPEHRGKCLVGGLLVTDMEILLASPAAGGLVGIDRQSGAQRVVALPSAGGTVVAGGDSVWVTGAAEGGGAEVQPGAPPPEGIAHPIVLEPPSQEEAERIKRQMPRAQVAASPEEALSIAKAAFPAQVFVDQPLPLWRIVGDSMEEVVLPGLIGPLAAVGDRLVGVTRTEDDPLIKLVNPSGRGATYVYPGSVFVWDPRQGATIVGSVGMAGGDIAINEDRALLIGFEHGPPLVRRLDLVSRTLSEPMPLGPPIPDEEEDIVMACRFWQGNARLLGIISSRYGLDQVVRLPDDASLDYAVSSRVCWIPSREDPAVYAVELGRRGCRRVEIATDLAPFAPPPVPPVDRDLREYERQTFERIRASLLDDRSSPRSFNNGSYVESVELTGTFPDSAVVVMVRYPRRRSAVFGRRLPLYDDLGNTTDTHYADVWIEEDVDTGSLDRVAISPGNSEVVWF